MTEHPVWTHTYEFDPEFARVAIIRQEMRWWGRLLMPLANLLTDLAYFGSREVREEVPGDYGSLPMPTITWERVDTDAE